MSAQEWLAAFLAEHGGVSGTVHFRQDNTLVLAAAVNIPEPVRLAVAVVPRGKGMAGLALERGMPVDTCNLKDDRSGNVRPGAKAVEAQAAVALPVRDSSDEIFAVVGIAFFDQRQFSAEDLANLSAFIHT